MARSVTALIEAFKVLTPRQPSGIDGMTFNIPFQRERFDEYLRQPKLRIGYILDDGFIPASPFKNKTLCCCSCDVFYCHFWCKC